MTTTALTEHEKNNELPQGIAKSGAERHRMDICERFNICSSIEL